MDQTDRPNTVPAWPTTLQEQIQLEATQGQGGYDPDAQGFFTLTLPGVVQLQEGGGVLVQIQNHGK